MNTTTAGIDLAKQVFAACVGDDRGHCGVPSVMRRDVFLKWLMTLPPGTMVAMEAYSAAHNWGRTASPGTEAVGCRIRASLPQESARQK